MYLEKKIKTKNYISLKKMLLLDYFSKVGASYLNSDKLT